MVSSTGFLLFQTWRLASFCTDLPSERAVRHARSLAGHRGISHRANSLLPMIPLGRNMITMTSAIIFFVSSSSECPPCFDFGLNKQKRRVSGLSRSHAFVLRFVVSANSEFVNRHHSTKYSAEACTRLVHQTIFRHNGQARAESSVCRQVSFYEICATGTNRMSKFHLSFTFRLVLRAFAHLRPDRP